MTELLRPDNWRGWRKFIVALAALAGAFILCLSGKVSGAEYVQAVTWTVGLFGAANAASHFAKKEDT